MVRNRALKDGDIKSLFLKEQVVAIYHVISTEEEDHLIKAHGATTNPHILQCIKYNLQKLRHNPDLRIIINNPAAIARNRGNDVLIVEHNLVKLYNVNNLPIQSVIGTLNYNLFELPDFYK